MFNQTNNNKNIFTNVIRKEALDVVIQTIDHVIRGKIHIRPEERLKEEMNLGELFLVITDATIFDKQNRVLHQCNFLVLNRTQVVWIFPENEENK